MACKVVFYSPAGHWKHIFDDMWTNLLHQANLHRRETNSTGADVKLCLSDGKILLHQAKLVKFTTILDFAKDKICDYTDPWGLHCKKSDFLFVKSTGEKVKG